MDARQPRTTKTEVDFTKPINKEEMSMSGCFGKMWDVATKECGQCSDKELCGILFKDTVDSKAQKVEDKLGTKFLDTVDFGNVKIKSWAVSGKTTINDLIARTMLEANTNDRDLTVKWLKTYITTNDDVYTKGGLLWIR